jgi:hypothetical protein
MMLLEGRTKQGRKNESGDPGCYFWLVGFGSPAWYKSAGAKHYG